MAPLQLQHQHQPAYQMMMPQPAPALTSPGKPAGRVQAALQAVRAPGSVDFSVVGGGRPHSPHSPARTDTPPSDADEL